MWGLVVSALGGAVAYFKGKGDGIKDVIKPVPAPVQKDKNFVQTVWVGILTVGGIVVVLRLAQPFLKKVL